MEIGKTARGERGAPGGELEMDHQNILKIENTEKYFRKIRIITNSRFKPARRPSSPPQWARPAHWRTWGSPGSPWCSQALAPCTWGSPRAWTLGLDLHIGESSSAKGTLTKYFFTEIDMRIAANLVRCEGAKFVHGEDRVETWPQRLQLTSHTPVHEKLTSG